MDVEAAVHQTHGDAPEHSNSSDMDSEVVFSVIPGDQRQKVMVIHCDDEKSKLYSSAQADFVKIHGCRLADLDLDVTESSFGKRAALFSESFINSIRKTDCGRNESRHNFDVCRVRSGPLEGLEIVAVGTNKKRRQRALAVGLVLSTLSACATSRSSLSGDITHRYACVRCVELMHLPEVPPPAPSCSRLLQVDDRGNVQTTGPASSSAGSAVQLVSDINAVACNPRAKSANWQVQFPSGWHDLPPEASSEIEAARLRGENVAIYEQCRSKKQDWWDTYQMDFANMQQTNLRSGTRRIARRIVDAGVEESSPAMPAELNAYGNLRGVSREPEETLTSVWQEPDVDRQRKKK